MAALDQIVNVTVSLSAPNVTQPSFSIPAIFGPSNRFAKSTATTANISTGSNQLTAIAALAGVSPGATIFATGVPAGTYILSVNGSSATMSAPATSTTTGVSIQFQDSIRNYSGGSSGLAAIVTDGFLTSDPEYIRAAAQAAQNPTPVNFYVGRNSASVAQQDTIAVSTLNTSHLYAFTLNGVVVSYQAVGGNAQQDILSGLLADIATVFPTGAPVTGIVTGTGGSALLTLTSVTPGAPVLYTAVDADLTQLNTVANHTLTTDIAQAQIQNNIWYGCEICSNTDGDISQVSAFIETQLKIFMGVTSTVAVATSATTDFASILKGKALKRTALVFTAFPTEGKEAAWMGQMLPTTPGASNWAYKTLVGSTPDVLTAAQQSALIGTPEAGIPGKNVNIYQTIAGVSITQMGWMIGGQYIDITIGLDWLQTTIQSNIYAALVAQAKIPYTDIGTSILLSAVRSAIDLGVTNGLIDGTSPISVTAPAVLSVPQSQRTNRIAPLITFSCRLQGAFDSVIVNGTVTT